MGPKDRLRRQLVNARELSLKLLGDFKKDEDWTRQVHSGANHALWFAGHMANTDNFLISLLDPTRAVDKPGFAEKFGMGSQPTAVLNDYPPINDVRAMMDERRKTLLEILDGLDEDGLATPTPHGAPEFLADFASVFELAIWHEGVHSGQLSVARRSLGHRPLD